MMRKDHIVPILGAIFSAFMCLLIIHFWGAAWYASYMDMSFVMAYAALAVVAVLFHLWRIVMILRDKDIVTTVIDKFQNGRE